MKIHEDKSNECTQAWCGLGMPDRFHRENPDAPHLYDGKNELATGASLGAVTCVECLEAMIVNGDNARRRLVEIAKESAINYERAEWLDGIIRAFLENSNWRNSVESSDVAEAIEQLRRAHEATASG